MKNYILDRLKAEAAGLVRLAEVEGEVQHRGLKGRLREILIDSILIPWLPPYVSCGTGMIIDSSGTYRIHTQDDIIVYDKSLVPPIISSESYATGIFLYNSVLMRIEVKSMLNREEVRKFVEASREIAELRHDVWKPLAKGFFGALNMLFAYGSDAEGKNDPDFEIKRIIDVMEEQHVDPLIVSVVCVLDRGLWKMAGTMDEDGKSKNMHWERLMYDDKESSIAWFVGCVSSTCYQQHAIRQGRDPTSGLETGIGRYIPSDVWVPVQTLPRN